MILAPGRIKSLSYINQLWIDVIRLNKKDNQRLEQFTNAE